MKYGKDFQLRLIGEVREGGSSVKETSGRYGVHPRQLSSWLAFYERYGLHGLEPCRRSYSGDFKLEVICTMRDKGLSLLETAVKFGIASHSTVLHWSRIYDREGAMGLYCEKRGRKKMKPTKAKKPKVPLTVEEELRRENELLRAEVAYLKKLRALVEERVLRESGNAPGPSKD